MTIIKNQMLALILLLPMLSTSHAGPFKTLDFLQSISGSKIAAGQHNDQKNFHGQATGPGYWTQRVFDITGKYPALWGGDFLFHGNSALRWDMVGEAKRQWNNGAMISIMWHVCPPTQGDSCGWEGGIKSSLNGSQWQDLLSDGGYLNTRWKQRMDSDVVPYLQDLENNGVEVLWRPLHEQNQHVFWWNTGSREDTKALFRLTRDYLTREKGLSNLIWVWDVQDIGDKRNFWDYNPGNQYFDMAALDIYGNGYYDSSFYDTLLGQASGKPVAFGENFQLPNWQVIANQPQMSFFMTWAYGLLEDYNNPPRPTNSEDFIREVYNYPNVITLDEMPGWNDTTPPNTAPNIAYQKPVTVSSTESGDNVAANAVDANGNSRWSSLYNDNEWIYVDLGSQFDIQRVRLDWEAAFARAYKIQLSNDAITWNTIYDTSTGDGSVDDISNLVGSGRYVRINGVQRGTSWGYSLWEFEVYGTATNEDDPTDPTIDVSITLLGDTGKAQLLSNGSRYIRYKAVIENAGSAADVVLTNTFPEGVNLRTISTPVGSCSDDGTHCQIGLLVEGQAVEIIIEVTVTDTQKRPFLAVVTTVSGVDDSDSNNMDSKQFGGALSILILGLMMLSLRRLGEVRG